MFLPRRPARDVLERGAVAHGQKTSIKTALSSRSEPPEEARLRDGKSSGAPLNRGTEPTDSELMRPVRPDAGASRTLSLWQRCGPGSLDPRLAGWMWGTPRGRRPRREHPRQENARASEDFCKAARGHFSPSAVRAFPCVSRDSRNTTGERPCFPARMTSREVAKCPG